jgi:hypothetical protein
MCRRAHSNNYKKIAPLSGTISKAFGGIELQQGMILKMTENSLRGVKMRGQEENLFAYNNSNDELLCYNTMFT